MSSMSDALSTFIRFIQQEFLPKRTDKEDVCRISRLGAARGGAPSFARIQQMMSTRPQPKALAVEPAFTARSPTNGRRWRCPRQRHSPCATCGATQRQSPAQRLPFRLQDGYSLLGR